MVTTDDELPLSERLNRSKTQKISKVQRLQELLKKRQSEYDAVLKDYEVVKKSLDHTAPSSFIQGLLNPPEIPNQILRLPNIEPKKKLSSNKQLSAYQTVTGIYITHISMRYYPVFDEESEVTDLSWTKFELDAMIRNVKFHLTYVSNQNPELVFDNNNVCELRELQIKMLEEAHQVELKDALNYYAKNPSKITLALHVIREYSYLFEERSRIVKALEAENVNLIAANIRMDVEKELYYVEIRVMDLENDLAFITIKWKILWTKLMHAMMDDFDISVHYEDQTFRESVIHSLSALSVPNGLLINGLPKYDNTDKLNHVRSNNKSEAAKLKLFKNAILACKAATSEYTK